MVIVPGAIRTTFSLSNGILWQRRPAYRVETRGLRTTRTDGADLPLSRDWEWWPLRTFDRDLRYAPTIPCEAAAATFAIPPGAGLPQKEGI